MVALLDIFDYIFHHSEHKTLGQSGERHLYLELRRQGVPCGRILRNVYIPALTQDGQPNGKTTEIDLLVFSPKGVLIFEHKAYSGKIYGDGRHQKWVQYLGGQKNYFLSPVEQNRYHKFCLQNFIGPDAPIYTFITRSQCGTWKISHLPEDAHFLQGDGDFCRIYKKLPPAKISAKTIATFRQKFQLLSRPTDGTREEHITNFNHKL